MATIPGPPIVPAPAPQHDPSHARRRSSASNSNPHNRRTSTHSIYARNVLMSGIRKHDHELQTRARAQANRDSESAVESSENTVESSREGSAESSRPPTQQPPRQGASAPPKALQDVRDLAARHGELKPPPFAAGQTHPHPHPHPPNHATPSHDGVGHAASDTPAPSHPNSPREYVTAADVTALSNSSDSNLTRNSSATSTPRLRPTTLDIPGLTKSKVSPDGKIAQRDVGSKLVIVMVGLPARGKSYITKKMARYLNWLQHDTKIFNVGEKRRVHAASTSGLRLSQHTLERVSTDVREALEEHKDSPAQVAARILINGESGHNGVDPLKLPNSLRDAETAVEDAPRVEVTSPNNNDNDNEGNEDENMDHSAGFFDPENTKAAQIREQCAMETLDDLLDYILKGSGSVGIFDATNSTLVRRKKIMDKIRGRAGPELNVLFVESVCRDQNLLESNMRLKLSGPDYRDQDPVAALEDFRKRVAIYEKNYVPIGDYEEDNNMPYVKMVDVGRKMISHQIKGFLAGQAVYYLLNFNLAPRMIWITRHGESEDNVAGRIGGDSDLSPNGEKYARAMTRFVENQRKTWAVRQADKIAHTHFPPLPGDQTPPNPYFGADADAKNFCVWTSMLKRSVRSASHFCDDDYEVKQMRMLDELNAGVMEGLTYDEIRSKYATEYDMRRADKLSYRYPGPGGEGYLDVINRIRPVIVELERMTDHCLLITHRSVARVLLAYFQGLKREDVADLDCPLGMLYQLEPKPYGVEFRAWRYNAETDGFEHLLDYELRRTTATPGQLGFG